MLLKDLLKKMDFDKSENNLEGRDNSDISSVRILSKDLKVLHPDVIYITDSQELYNNLIKENSPYLVVLSKEKESIFNKISDIFLEEQHLSKGIWQLMESLSSRKGLDNIVETGSLIIGNPLFIRDMNFNIIGFTKNVSVNDRVWNDLTTKGYQDYSAFQYLMKNGFIDRVNKYEIPIYYHVFSVQDDNENKQGNPEEIEVYSEQKYLLHPMYDNNINISRVWCRIGYGDKVLGHLVVLDAQKEFSDIDILLIKKLADTIALELQKNEPIKNTIIQQDSLILELLLDKLKDQDILEEKLKIFNLKFKKYMRVIALSTNNYGDSGIPVNYIKGFFTHVFGNISGVFHNGNYIAIYNSDTSSSISDSKLDLLYNFAKDTGTHCGISRPFTNLLNLNKYYRQCLEAIKSGRRIDERKFLYSYEDYVLQDIFSICSAQDSLMNFFHPALTELINYDTENKTDYANTLHAYIMKFKNPSDLAIELNIHRNTLYYRLTKIEEIMNVKLDNMDTLYGIYMSFKILEFIGNDES